MTDVALAPTATAVPLRAVGLTLGYGRTTAVHATDLDVAAGAVTCVVGPNGCGKSTLLRGLAGLLPARGGHVEIGGERLATLGVRETARRVAVLPQQAVAPDGLTVADLVARGRQPYQSWLRQWVRTDEQVVHEAMARTGVLDLADRALDELSGGQRQRAWVAMALAQDTPVLLLDEPTTFLDIAHAVEVLALVRRLAVEDGRTVLVVLHDLSLAARYCDRMVVMHDGVVHAAGAPADVLTETLLRAVFDVDARVFPDPVDGVPMIAPR